MRLTFNDVIMAEQVGGYKCYNLCLPEMPIRSIPPLRAYLIAFHAVVFNGVFGEQLE